MLSESIESGKLTIGLGVMKCPMGSDFWVHLGSSIHGHSSLAGHNPDKELTVVVLANIDPEYDDYGTHFEMANAINDEFD